MSDTTSKPTHKSHDTGSTDEIGQIKPVKVVTNEDSKLDTDKEFQQNVIADNPDDVGLMKIIRAFLKSHGLRKSAAAIRNAVEMPHDRFTAKEAVSALSNLGFKASFGNISLKKLGSDFFPLIAFRKNGTAVILNEIISNNKETEVSYLDEKLQIKKNYP